MFPVDSPICSVLNMICSAPNMYDSFVWALTTTALSRLLLNLRRVEIESNISLICGRSSPFALQLVHRHEAKASVSGEVEIEMDVWTS